MVYILKHMKWGKAPGPDGIINEMMMYVGAGIGGFSLLSVVYPIGRKVQKDHHG